MTYQTTATCQNADGTTVVLTKPEDSHLNDWELIPLARQEAKRIGLELGNDLILTGVWI